MPNNEDKNELTLAGRQANWRRLKALVLDSVSSPITKRVSNLGLDEVFEWFGQEPHQGSARVGNQTRLRDAAKITRLA